MISAFWTYWNTPGLFEKIYPISLAGGLKKYLQTGRIHRPHLQFHRIFRLPSIQLFSLLFLLLFPCLSVSVQALFMPITFINSSISPKSPNLSAITYNTVFALLIPLFIVIQREAFHADSILEVKGCGFSVPFDNYRCDQLGDEWDSHQYTAKLIIVNKSMTSWSLEGMIWELLVWKKLAKG